MPPARHAGVRSRQGLDHAPVQALPAQDGEALGIGGDRRGWNRGLLQGEEGPPVEPIGGGRRIDSDSLTVRAGFGIAYDQAIRIWASCLCRRSSSLRPM